MNKLKEKDINKWIDIVISEFIEGNIPHNNLDEVCEEETTEYFKEYPDQYTCEDDKSEFYMNLKDRLERIIDSAEYSD